MSTFCLVPEAIERFKNGLRDGTIDPYKLNQLSSDERRAIFSKVVGADVAKEVNASFESKILLKNQKYAYTAWAKKVANITPETRRDIISRIEKIDHILNPTEEQGFLKDLAAKKLGIDVSQEEAKNISDLSNKVSQTRALQKDDGTFDKNSDRLSYGKAKVELGNYVNKLKLKAEKPSLGHLATHPGKAITTLASTGKSIQASLDDSALFRQGWKTLFTNPLTWQRNARKSFVDIAKEFSGKDVLDQVHADIVSRPNYERMQKAGLATSNVEEAYPTALPGKIPILGRAYKASESAYTGFLYRQRADIFDRYIDIMKRTGVNIDDKVQLKALGKLVNSLTGRGHLGGLEPAANTINSVFFSPRSVKSNIDTLTAHQFQKNITPFVRKQAAISTAKVIAGTAAVFAIANAAKPGSVELDPRSTDFGKIRIGDTRFDVTGGMDAIATLAARLVTQSSKTSTTGKVAKFGNGFGQPNATDILTQFFENKLSPAASVIKDLVTQKTYSGTKPTAKGEIGGFFNPLPVVNVQELRSDPNSANKLLSSIADSLGIVTNTYGNTPTGTHGANSKVSNALKDAQFSVNPPQHTERKVNLTPAQYNQFESQSNQLFVQSVNKALADPAYRALPSNLKNKTLAKALTNAKSTVLDKILPNTAVPKKGQPGYYQYQQKQKLLSQNTPKIKAY